MKMDMRRWWWWWWVFGIIFIWMLTPTTSFCPPLCSCDDVTLFTNCHEARNLKMVPIFLNPQTKFLSLSQNQIKEITMSLQFYSELQLLDFSQNQIESIGENNFENLRNLKVLNISYNTIRVLESDAFIGLRQTFVLDLSVNQIESIDQNALRGLVEVREIYMDRNRLERLDWDLFSELVSLERLSLRFNFIRILQPPRSLTPFLFNQSNNKNLSRRSQSEKLLPLTSTSRTLLSNSSVLEIPWTLQNVIEVDLSWNQLAAVRNYGLSPLLSSLQILNLCCNYIHTVEENAFVSVPFEFYGGSHSKSSENGLVSLNLSQNRLTTIPSDALEKIGSSLVELDLSSNRISDDLPPSSFRSLFQLRSLKISENKGIKRIDSNALLDNIHLVEFEANHLSNLTQFPVGLFNNKPYLEVMSVQFGQITTLPKELFEQPIYNSLLSTLDLYGNPIDCNCTAWKLFQFVVKEEHLSPLDVLTSQTLPHQQHVTRMNQINNEKHHKKVPLGSIQCNYPMNLQQFKIRDLSQSDFTHCFNSLSFPHEHFELLVILLAATIVFLILLAVGIKLCCLYHLCPNQKRRKEIMNLQCGKDKDGTTLDEFCSNVGLGGVCGSDSLVTSTSGGKIISNNFNNGNSTKEYRHAIPISPALSSKSKKSVTLPNGCAPYHHGRPQNGHGVSIMSNRSSPRSTTTLGPRVPVPYDYEDDEIYHHQYKPIDNRHPQPTQATMTFSNKLRFNPKMQLVLDSDPEQPEYPILQGQHPHPPPPHLLYEYDYPDYRNTHASQQRMKQVPSVLV